MTTVGRFALGFFVAWLWWGPAGASAAENPRLVLAGSGANIPLMTKLAEAYRAEHPGIEIDVPKSIGSTGGIKAAAEGAVALGLSSRPLDVRESASGLRALPYARVAIVMAAHPGVPADGLSTEDLISIVRGTKTTWSNGQEIVVFMRQFDESNNTVLKEGVPGLAPVLDEAIRTQRWRILFHDHEMADALAKTPYSLGVSNVGNATAARLKILALDGIAPTAANVEQGRYRLTNTLYIIQRSDLPPAVSAFLAFVRSPHGARLIKDTGYLPLP